MAAVCCYMKPTLTFSHDGLRCREGPDAVVAHHQDSVAAWLREVIGGVRRVHNDGASGTTHIPGEGGVGRDHLERQERWK